MFKDKKNLAILVLTVMLLIACWCCVFIAFFNKPKEYDKTLLETRLKQLQSENSHYEQIISVASKKIHQYSMIIDSLQSLKPQIETKYVTKTKQIDNASVSAIVSEYSIIFSDDDIK